MFKIERVHYSSTWCKGMTALLKKVRKYNIFHTFLLVQKPLQQCRTSGHTLDSQNFKDKEVVLFPYGFPSVVDAVFFLKKLYYSYS